MNPKKMNPVVCRQPMDSSTAGDSQLMFAFAHDLRAHLRTMLTRVQLLQTGGAALLPESDRQYLDQAVAAARDMDSLITSMTAYWDAGATDEDVDPLPLLLRGLLLEMKTPLTAADATVVVTNECEAMVPHALYGVLKELLANSVRFRRPERKLQVRLAAWQAEEQLEISVEDNGSGVDIGFHDKLFVPFRRMHPRAGYQGSGLGLARCRKIIEAYGGTISAAASSDAGLAVTLILPLPAKA